MMKEMCNIYQKKNSASDMKTDMNEVRKPKL